MPAPYMGSKRTSASRIYNIISSLNKKGTLVDPFCGGFAISEKFLEHGWKTISSDKNEAVVELIKHAVSGGFNDRKFKPKFLTKDDFNYIIKNSSNHDPWYVGYAQCIWSFGNTQTNYLYGKEVEPVKSAGHSILVYGNTAELKKLFKVPDIFIHGILKQGNWHKGRMALKLVSNKLALSQPLIEKLEHMEHLSRLELLQQLENKKWETEIEFHAGNYKDVPIPKGAVVYCDPPYASTAEYAEGGFNHEEFWDWVRELSKTNKVYISEYSAPKDFTAILRFPQKSKLQGGVQSHNNQPDECLFVPIGQDNT